MKNKSSQCDLQSCFMCRLVLKEWKMPIDSYRKNFVIKKGETFIKEGDPLTGIYFIYSGKVKVHKTWGAKELIVRFASDGAIVGHRGLSSNSTGFPVSATALETTTVCFIELDFFLSTLKVNPALTFELMMFYADELQESERRMRNLALMPVKGRLARAFIQLEEQFGLNDDGNINIELSRQDYASFTGTTYETVFRTINELIKEDLISVQGKLFGIKNRPLLQALTEQLA